MQVNNMNYATIKDVAKKANTSYATVSRVLNNVQYPVSKGLKKRVLDAVQELNYTPNYIARSIKEKKTSDIGIVVPNITNPFYSNYIAGVEEVLMEHNYNIFVCNSRRNPEKEEKILQSLMMKRVRGIILSSSSRSTKTLKQIKDMGVILVLIDQFIEGLSCTNVMYDYHKIGYLATKHLIELGHKKIAYVTSPIDRFSRKKIFDGYKHALKTNDIKYDSSLVSAAWVEKEQMNEVFEYTNGYRLTKDLIKKGRKFTALFACNDMTAIGALQAIKDMELSVPGDVSVMGCDNLLSCCFISPKLSTVDVPASEVSRIAAKLLLEKIKGESKETSIVLQPSLVLRESTCEAMQEHRCC